MSVTKIFAKKTGMKPKKSSIDFEGSRSRNSGLPKLRGMFISPGKMIEIASFQNRATQSPVPGPYRPQLSMRHPHTGTPFGDPENELVVTAEEWRRLRYNE
jgi:hypothetical protein